MILQILKVLIIKLIKILPFKKTELLGGRYYFSKIKPIMILAPSLKLLHLNIKGL
jgi:hypothetical protein